MARANWGQPITGGPDRLWGTEAYTWKGDPPGDRFFDPYNPLNEKLITIESWQDLTYDASGDVVRVYGRADPVVVTDIRSYPSGSLKVVTLDQPQREWLGSLLAPGRVIGFYPSDPSFGYPSPTYLYVGKVLQSRVVRRVTAQERRWDLDVQVVEAPVIS